ncbi:DUF3616 domain-containing protein [Paracraurococcus ruber]|uniref:DUF3616 domain-containing protein n=1 Tax=Paracraurococcus ruber TaxID=77675 RepID=A0ABS1CXN1_9PROT|nr:DUF3616 domain-containing protein [Paracraurococcus ruber]MBK1659073.1 hypothetical protein [Paracraurococcus ruber]TDG32268.1 DUF3616 domain-containing protein [Paracraurococcus ruber]
MIRALLLLCLLALPAAAREGEALDMTGRFEGKEGKRARDLSGIACRPGSFPLDCLLENDESGFAQRATLHRHTLEAGAIMPLIGDRPPAEAAGSATALGTCPGGTAGWGEFDGEAVAFRAEAGGAGSVFVAGSHSCSRSLPARLRASTHLLARIGVDAAGRYGAPALSWRLTPMLRALPVLGGHVGQPLTAAAQGLDIEGMAAIGETLVFGLRAPVLDGEAFIVTAAAAALFDPAPPADRSLTAAVARIPLGPGTGIRDLAALPDGRLLVLSGPAQDQDLPFGLHLVHPGPAPRWVPLPLLPDLQAKPGEKAEGVAVLGIADGKLTALVLFEDPQAGGARLYTLPLPR